MFVPSAAIYVDNIVPKALRARFPSFFSGDSTRQQPGGCVSVAGVQYFISGPQPERIGGVHKCRPKPGRSVGILLRRAFFVRSSFPQA